MNGNGTGKFTLNDGDWPSGAKIVFGCEPTKGFPRRTCSALVAKDGSFTVSTCGGKDADGLMPGKH
ncbi:MAG TPA: hypothetical protein DD670_05700 [Planctomycetaceae bacterium]|nr:hypothetical protein [Planctomycetaceae bacterium]